MVGDGCESSGFRVAPDLVASGCMAKKLKAKGLEFLDDLSVFED